MQEGLWWLPLGGRQREAVRKVVLLVSVLAALGGLEGRVIFRAFGQYIMLHPPWSYLVVTVALYGSAALLAMYFAGASTQACIERKAISSTVLFLRCARLSSLLATAVPALTRGLQLAGMLTATMQGSFASTVAGALLIACSCAGAFAAGVPLLVMPAPLVAASGLFLWFESGQLRDYAIFVAGALLTTAWFVHHHFGFLEVNS